MHRDAVACGRGFHRRPRSSRSTGSCTRATLDTTIELFDFVSEITLTVDVTVAWTGTGATFTQKQPFHVTRL
jgi:hypothetical protein